MNPYWPSTQSKPTGNQNSANNSQKNPTTPATSNETWKNPYWKDSKSPSSTATNQQQQDKPWVNPYWKDSKPPSSTATNQQQDKPWVNPYWKDSKTENSTTSNQQQDKPWVNPYWKDSKTENTTTSNQQQEKPWVNPYWKDKNTSDQKIGDSVDAGSLSFEYKELPIPPFYERIYPPYPPSSSPVPNMDITQSNMSSTSGLKQDAIDDEGPPFTIDNQGTAHYRAASSSTAPIATSKPVTFPPPSTSSPYPLSPPNPSNTTAPPAQTSYTASTPKSAENMFSSPPANVLPPVPLPNNTVSTLVSNSANLLNYPSQTSPSANFLTEADVQTIQNALRSFETNSGAINVVDASTENLSFNTTHPNTLSSFPFANNQGQQSLLPESMPPSGGAHSGNTSSPLAALISGSPLQQSNQQSSNARYPNNSSSPLGALFAGNPVQQPNQPENRTSPLSILFTRNEGQQPNQPYSIGTANVVYSDDGASPLSTFFTRTSAQQLNQPQILTSSSLLSQTGRISRPYSYDSHSQLLSVYYTPNSPPQLIESSGRRITQQPVVFI